MLLLLIYVTSLAHSIAYIAIIVELSFFSFNVTRVQVISRHVSSWFIFPFQCDDLFALLQECSENLLDLPISDDSTPAPVPVEAGGQAREPVGVAVVLLVPLFIAV
uniref:Uncharacterized protein n=1 Tax=Ixodes ricinus TaxID=34613 RepID=A0A6B0UBP5_IXORI